MRNKYSISDKRKILNDYLSNKNDYSSIKEYAHLHGINPSTMHDFLRQSDEILAGSQDATQDTTGDIITLSHQIHVIAPYTIIDLHLNMLSLYHGRVSAASEVIDKYGHFIVGMIMVNPTTSTLDIFVYEE